MSDVCRRSFTVGEVFAFVFNCKYFEPGKNGIEDIFRFILKNRQCNSDQITEAIRKVAVVYVKHLYPDLFSEVLIQSVDRFFSKIQKEEYPDWLKEEQAVKFVLKFKENHDISRIELAELPDTTLMYINDKLEKKISEMRAIACLAIPPFIPGVMVGTVEIDLEEIKKTF